MPANLNAVLHACRNAGLLRTGFELLCEGHERRFAPLSDTAGGYAADTAGGYAAENAAGGHRGSAPHAEDTAGGNRAGANTAGANGVPYRGGGGAPYRGGGGADTARDYGAEDNTARGHGAEGDTARGHGSTAESARGLAEAVGVLSLLRGCEMHHDATLALQIFSWGLRTALIDSASSGEQVSTLLYLSIFLSICLYTCTYIYIYI